MNTRNTRENEGIQRNTKERQGILRNTKEHKGVLRNEEDYKGIQRKYTGILENSKSNEFKGMFRNTTTY